MAAWPRWPRGWQSQAEREVNNTEVSGDGGPWGDRPVLTAYSASAMFLYVAGESLTAKGVSLSTATTPLVPGILGRAAIEADSKVSWLMASNFSPRERVIRWTLCRVASAHYLARTSKAVDPKGDASSRATRWPRWSPTRERWGCP